MTLSERLTIARKMKGLTQSDVAEKLKVSFQAVSLWERGETTPDIDKLVDIAALYQVSIDWLLTGKIEENVFADFQDSLSDRLFDEKRMYTYIKTYASVKNLYQTSKVLPYARELHEGQFRKGKDHVPYIYHPLLLACHALALGLDDDNIVSAALLHDVCEDCDVTVESLPVNEETKIAVSLLTKGEKTKLNEEQYYTDISQNSIATMVKLLDRCNNISGMATGFSKKKMVEYIKETECLVYPLMQKAKSEYPMYSNQIFLIKYHMTSVIETLKHFA
ncbi:MAG: helix-turn-helix domain-containing protein [Lachnospiraceae bacterium]|nr:helix-turn-helix domain-containing protein [Lachnospiraceae bacterium]